MRSLFDRYLQLMKHALRYTNRLGKKMHFLSPFFKRLFPFRGPYEIFHFHLRKLTQAEDEIARRNLVAERFSYLRDAERQCRMIRINCIFKINEDTARRLRAQIYGYCLVSRTGRSREHRIEHLSIRERIGECFHMAGCFPDFWVHQCRSVNAIHIVPLIAKHLEPQAFNILFQPEAEMPVVIRSCEAAVDLGTGEDEPTAFAKRDYLFHKVLFTHKDTIP